MSATYSQWSTLTSLRYDKSRLSLPENHAERISSYLKYEELYWNDPTQFKIRILSGEAPIYIPNAQVVVNTTSHYVMKGLQVVADPDAQALNDKLKLLLDRERFYSRFNDAKTMGVVKGDGVIHLRANPLKAPGSRISINMVLPDIVFPEFDSENPDKLVKCDLVSPYTDPARPTENFVRKLTYTLVEDTNGKRVFREEGIFKTSPNWWTKEAQEVQNLIPLSPLDPRITSIPIYWVRNRSWLGWEYGSSELKSLETMLWGTTQQASDLQASLSLDGLGVYATDGGRPIDDAGNETDWEVYPGAVIELSPGSKFTRVGGVMSIAPSMDYINYLERKVQEATSTTDVALGRIDTQVAESGISLAISFLPTLAKVETRDTAGKDILRNLFYDWKIWNRVYEGEQLDGEVLIELGDKLPQDRTGRINELNNMFDRKIISAKYYREEMTKLGYAFPENIEAELLDDTKRAAQAASLLQQQKGDIINENQVAVVDASSTLPVKNSSNNKDRVNESNGTEV